MIEVGRFPTRTEAELARSLLSEAGMPSVLAPHPIDLNGAARLLVADADAAPALAILSAHAAPDEGGT